MRYAAALAKRRSGKLTLVHKTNVLVNAGSLWKRVADEVAAEQGLELDYAHVDAACLYMVSDPGRFDVIVTDNLFGDILTDLAAALTGGLGLSASANLNPDKTGPSVFEPVHGSARTAPAQAKPTPPVPCSPHPSCSTTLSSQRQQRNWKLQWTRYWLGAVPRPRRPGPTLWLSSSPRRRWPDERPRV